MCAQWAAALLPWVLLGVFVVSYMGAAVFDDAENHGAASVCHALTGASIVGAFWAAW